MGVQGQAARPLHITARCSAPRSVGLHGVCYCMLQIGGGRPSLCTKVTWTPMCPVRGAGKPALELKAHAFFTTHLLRPETVRIVLH
eukprot:scaffold50302_cov19-Tisochrysis_lutea.AAC.2